MVTADPSAANATRIRARYGTAVSLRHVSKQAVWNGLEARFRSHLLDSAVWGLARRYPEFSADRVVTEAQATILIALPLLLVLALCAMPVAVNALLFCLLTLTYVANVLLRVALVWLGAAPGDHPVPPACGEAPDLPLYSIIVPLHREARVVPTLVDALGRLDYPSDRLEIVFVLEADDTETIAAVQARMLDERFVVLKVPPGEPRTKPRAANYALRFLSGMFTVIYDAEDRPEPDQLRKALALFRAAPGNVACLQARLNFYNARENWLTRMFALDYALWFDFLLPGLDRLGIPMPLGGTSNHFRTDALRAIAGWDAHNVTEDADLGIRLARLGLRVRTLDSTTYEEAPVDLGNWLRQRSRWMKGYMQTWLVHMRNPARLMRHSGVSGFLGFQLFVGGTFLTGLLNPLMWAVFLCSLLFGSLPYAGLLSAPSTDFPLLGLFVGNVLFTYLAMLGPCRRGWLDLVPQGLGAPLYWALISAASYRGLWHLFVKPWHWEKTDHGRTRQPAVLFVSGGEA